MAKPKEDPKDKAARLRERRISELERKDGAQGTAAGLTSDLRAVYGLKNMTNMFNFNAKPVSSGGGNGIGGVLGGLLGNQK